MCTNVCTDVAKIKQDISSLLIVVFRWKLSPGAYSKIIFDVSVRWSVDCNLINIMWPFNKNSRMHLYQYDVFLFVNIGSRLILKKQKKTE